MIGEYIYMVTGGNIYLLLLGVFLIFYFDSMFLTLLPEVFILLFYANKPETLSVFGWIILLVIMANIGDVAGNYTVYLLFNKWKWFHRFASEKLRKYVNFLVLKDEKLILLNRVAPALPMCGVFMAACHWSVKRSLFYIYIGGLVKYSLILMMFGFLDWLYPVETAFWIMIAFVGVFLVFSFFLGRRERRRLAEKLKAEGEKANELCIENEKEKQGKDEQD